MRVSSASSTLPGSTNLLICCAQTLAIGHPIREPAVRRTTVGKLQVRGPGVWPCSAARLVSTWKTGLLLGTPRVP